MASLKGKVAVVTGASRGIGRGIAERLAKDGAAVVVNYTKSADEAEKVVAGIKAHGLRLGLRVRTSSGRMAGLI